MASYKRQLQTSLFHFRSKKTYSLQNIDHLLNQPKNVKNFSGTFSGKFEAIMKALAFHPVLDVSIRPIIRMIRVGGVMRPQIVT